MTIQELFIRSNEELKKVIDQIADDQWETEVPAGMTRQPGTLRSIVNYHTYDDAWVPDVLAGKTKDEVGEQYEGLLTLAGGDTLSEYDKYNAQAIEAVRTCADADLARTTHLSYGDFPARDYLQHIISFRAFRVYDLAKLIGADTKLPEDFVQALWDEFTPVIEGYRQMGVFPAAIAAPDDADLQTKLLALVGRR